MKILIPLSIGLGLVFSGFAAMTNETFLVGNQKIIDNGFETKATDKNGRILYWFQHFPDSSGKEIVQIIRKSGGAAEPPPYESIEYVITYSYNTDDNLSQMYEFYGDGRLRRHTIYRYDEHGNYIRGDIYDSTGKLIAHETTEPEHHMYGKKRQK